MNKFIPFIVLILAFSACEDPNIKQAQKHLSKATESVEEAARKEIDKLKTVEYRVVEMEAKSSSDELQESLTELGQDHWDCFHVQAREQKYVIFCKRLAKTYLRYLQKGL